MDESPIHPNADAGYRYRGPQHVLKTSFRCNPAPMDGVKLISVGPDPFGGRSALVGCAV